MIIEFARFGRLWVIALLLAGATILMLVKGIFAYIGVFILGVFFAPILSVFLHKSKNLIKIPVSTEEMGLTLLF